MSRSKDPSGERGANRLPPGGRARTQRQSPDSETRSDIEEPMTVKAEPASLQSRIRELSEREARVSERTSALEKREAETDDRKARLDEERKRLDDRKQELRKLEGDLTSRGRTIREQEMEAEAGFARRNREAIKALEAEHAALRSKIEEMRTEALGQLQQRLDQEEHDRRTALDEELRRTRETAVASLISELDERRQRIDAEISIDRAKIEKERQRVTDALTRREENVACAEQARAERDKELLVRERRLEAEKEVLSEDRELLEAKIEQRADERVAGLEHAIRTKDERIERLKSDRDRFEKKVDAFDDVRRRFGYDEPEEVLKKIETLEAECDRLREELNRRPSREDGERLVVLEEQRRGWERKRDEMAKDLAELRAREGDWLLAVNERERLRDLCAVAKRRREALQAEMEKLGEEVGRLRSLYEQPKEREARIGVIEQPRFTDLPSAQDPLDDSEMAWLDRTHKLCEKSGLGFPHRLLHAFHTSLKTADWTPLTVLGGVSGTGKSELPRLYARFGGLAFEPLSVQPNWDSPQSLFGFFNSVDNRFNATPLLRALVQSQRAPADNLGLRNRLLLVLLDEMNLSHVELYFSDLLSKLELRRGAREEVPLEVDLGAGLQEYSVPLGRNVLWVGTMNEDETTKSLSDKVLDRSNLLGFPRPHELRRRQEATIEDRQPMLSMNTWNGWVCRRSDLSADEAGKYKDVLEKMNAHLERVGRALGHRVWQAVESYMANYPKVRVAKSSGDNEALHAALRTAFEDALVQKVMPKLRGIETTGNARTECLDPIAKLLADPELGLRLAEDFELASSVGYAFVWRSAKYLEAGE